MRKEGVKDEGWRERGRRKRGKERRKGWRKRRRERKGGKTKPQAVDNIKKVPGTKILRYQVPVSSSIDMGKREPTSPGCYKVHTVGAKALACRKPFLLSFTHLNTYYVQT